MVYRRSKFITLISQHGISALSHAILLFVYRVHWKRGVRKRSWYTVRGDVSRKETGAKGNARIETERRVPRGSARRITKQSLDQLKSRLGINGTNAVRAQATCVSVDEGRRVCRWNSARPDTVAGCYRRWHDGGRGRGFHRRLAAGIWKAIKTSKETILRLGRFSAQGIPTRLA